MKVANLARSTFFYQLKQLQIPDENAELKELIHTLYYKHNKKYGYRRIALSLYLKGITVNHKKVLRLMQSMGLKADRPKLKYKAYVGVSKGSAVGNILQRQFNPKASSEKFVTDVTEFKVNDQKYYFSPIMDLFNKEVISYTLFKRPTFKMVKDMLSQALPKMELHKKPLLHSDQGWHYRMPEFKTALADAGIQQSMSRKGNCWDNAVIESFFATFKHEFFDLFKGKPEEGLQESINDYMHYYNEERIRLDLKMSPVQYRTQYENNLINAVQ